MGVSMTYTYRGEICGMTKGSLERSIESDKELLEGLWQRMMLYAQQTPPVYAKSEVGTEYPWPEFLVEEFRRIREEMEEYYWGIHHKEDALEAMKDDPKSVEDSI